MPATTERRATETIDATSSDLDLRDTEEILATLLASQRGAADAVERARAALERAVTASAERLGRGEGRLVLAGAGASGRLAVQDGAELWPTFGWPAARTVLAMAGGEQALVHSIEGVEDDARGASDAVAAASIGASDVVVALAASGGSPWTCAWLVAAREAGALTIGIANNAGTPLLAAAEHPVLLETGPEVLAGSTRMAAGTAQKIALNLFSTTLMIRLNRTWGNLMVDMAAANVKLDARRIRLLQGVLPHLDDAAARRALDASGGWIKLAALVASGEAPDAGRARLERCGGSLRKALTALES